MQKKVLLVDDESSIRRSLSLGLSQEGYEVDPCENGISALKKLELYENNDIDLNTIVLDINLPDIDGIKLGKIIRQKYPDVNIVYITGYADKYNINEINSLNVSAVLNKPFTAADLTFTFAEITEKQGITTSKTTEKKKKTTESAYALIKLQKGSDFFETYKKIYYLSNTLYCDMTKGEYDIFVLAQGCDMDECRNFLQNEIKEIEGVEDVTLLEITPPLLDESTQHIIQLAENVMGEESDSPRGRDLQKRVCSYLLLEIEPEKLDKLYPVLRLTENVVYCDYTSGKYNMVLFVTGSYFNEIDKLVEEKIVHLDGVLKIKEFPVVNMFDM